MLGLAIFTQMVAARKPMRQYIDHTDGFGDDCVKEVCRVCGQYYMPHNGMVQHCKVKHGIKTKTMRKLPIPLQPLR